MNEDFELRKIQLTEEEREIDRSIRPKDFSDFNGQDKLVQNLKVFVQAARLRKESLDHVILSVLRVLVKQRWPILSAMN